MVSRDVQADSLGRTCSQNCPSDLSPDCPGSGPDRVTVDTDTVHGASRHVRKSSGVIQIPAQRPTLRDHPRYRNATHGTAS